MYRPGMDCPESARPRARERFKPATLRAATRLVRLACLGRVTTNELLDYARSLTEIDGPHGAWAERALVRLAIRRAAFAHTAASGPTRWRRCPSRHFPSPDARSVPDETLRLV